MCVVVLRVVNVLWCALLLLECVCSARVATERLRGHSHGVDTAPNVTTTNVIPNQLPRFTEVMVEPPFNEMEFIVRCDTPATMLLSPVQCYTVVVVEAGRVPCTWNATVPIHAAYDIFIGPCSTVGANVRFGQNVTVGRNSALGVNVTLAGNNRVGANVSIGVHSVVGVNTTLNDNVVVGPHNTIGSDCVIGVFVQTSCHTVIDSATILGAYVSLGAYTTIGTRSVLASYVAVASNVVLVAGVTVKEHSTLHAGVYVGRNAKIGALVTVGTRAVVGDFTWVRAGVWIWKHTRVAAGVVVGVRMRVSGPTRSWGALVATHTSPSPSPPTTTSPIQIELGTWQCDVSLRTPVWEVVGRRRRSPLMNVAPQGKGVTETTTTPPQTTSDGNVHIQETVVVFVTQSWRNAATTNPEVPLPWWMDPFTTPTALFMHALRGGPQLCSPWSHTPACFIPMLGTRSDFMRLVIPRVAIGLTKTMALRFASFAPVKHGVQAVRNAWAKASAITTRVVNGAAPTPSLYPALPMSQTPSCLECDANNQLDTFTYNTNIDVEIDTDTDINNFDTYDDEYMNDGSDNNDDSYDYEEGDIRNERLTLITPSESTTSTKSISRVLPKPMQTLYDAAATTVCRILHRWGIREICTLNPHRLTHDIHVDVDMDTDVDAEPASAHASWIHINDQTPELGVTKRPTQSTKTHHSEDGGVLHPVITSVTESTFRSILPKSTQNTMKRWRWSVLKKRARWAQRPVEDALEWVRRRHLHLMDDIHTWAQPYSNLTHTHLIVQNLSCKPLTSYVEHKKYEAPLHTCKPRCASPVLFLPVHILCAAVFVDASPTLPALVFSSSPISFVLRGEVALHVSFVLWKARGATHPCWACPRTS